MTDYATAKAAFDAALDKLTALLSEFNARIADETVIVTKTTDHDVLYTIAGGTLRGVWCETEIGLNLFGKGIQWSLMESDGGCVSGGFAATLDDAYRCMAYSARARRAEAELQAVSSEMTAALDLMMALSVDSESGGDAAVE